MGMSTQSMSLTDRMPFIGVQPLLIGEMRICGDSARTVSSYRHIAANTERPTNLSRLSAEKIKEKVKNILHFQKNAVTL